MPNFGLLLWKSVKVKKKIIELISQLQVVLFQNPSYRLFFFRISHLLHHLTDPEILYFIVFKYINLNMPRSKQKKCRISGESNCLFWIKWWTKWGLLKKNNLYKLLTNQSILPSKLHCWRLLWTPPFSQKQKTTKMSAKNHDFSCTLPPLHWMNAFLFAFWHWKWLLRRHAPVVLRKYSHSNLP